jgi:hypothetical protein
MIAVLILSFVSPLRAQTAARLKAGAGIIIYPVLSDRTEEFEAPLETVGHVVQQSENPVRRQQARGWRVFRAKEPGLDPVVKLADYDVMKAVTEEANQFNRKWTGRLAGPQTVLDLQLVTKLATGGRPQKR